MAYFDKSKSSVLNRLETLRLESMAIVEFSLRLNFIMVSQWGKSIQSFNAIKSSRVFEMLVIIAASCIGLCHENISEKE